MKYYLVLFYLFGFLFIGCNEVSPKGDKELRAFVQQWNENHTLLKSPYLKRDYMDVVSYYGEERTKNEVQEDKTLLFQQFPDYTQHVLDDQINITKEGGKYLASFTNVIHYNGIEAAYDSYLSLTIRNGAFKILREGVTEGADNIDAPIFPSARENSRFTSSTRQLFGDFNGDDLSDYASVRSPEIISTSNTDTQTNNTIECKGGCNSVIVFSAKNLTPITVKGVYQSQLENLKDLNGDGADEIGFWDIKPTSKSLYIYNATTGNLLTDPVIINTTVHKNLKLIDVFKKTGPNKITVTRSVQVNGKWILQSEVIVVE